MCFRALALFFGIFVFHPALAAKCSFDTPDSFLSRVVAVDTAQRPKEGGADQSTFSPFELRSKEVVLTFEQGPHSSYTGFILDILDAHCAKAIFFVSGSAALGNPEAVRDVVQRGHTLALASSSAETSEAGIEKGFAAITKSSAAPVAPFLFANAASDKPETSLYLKTRGVSLWYADLDSRDTEPGLSPTQLANRTLLKIREMGKGVIQFHDTRKVTVDCLDSILTGLRLGGFKVVQPVPVTGFAPKDEYLAQVTQKQARVDGSPARTSRRLLDEARRRVLLSERADPDSRRHVHRRENAN